MKFHVYYAGEKLIFDEDPFKNDDLTEPATLKVKQSNGRFVTLTLGPGIPILVKEAPATQRAIRIL